MPTKLLIDTYVKKCGFAVLPCWGIDTSQPKKPVTKPSGITVEIHPCRCPQGYECAAAGKHPRGDLVRNGAKSASRDPAIINEWIRRNAGGNWAIATGMPIDSSDRYLVCLDVDPRNGGDDSYVNLIQQYGPNPQTMRDVTGGGGSHEFFATPEPLSCGAAGPGIDIKGAGGYVVVEPSIHETGNRYFWEASFHPNDVELGEAPAWILSGGSSRRVRPPWNGRSAADSIVGVAFREAGWLGKELGEGRFAVRCPQAHLHSDGRGLGDDSSSAILPPFNHNNFGSFVCSHSHCSGIKWADIVRLMPSRAIAIARETYPQVETPAEPELEPVAIIPSGPPPDVMAMLSGKSRRDGSFAPDKTAANIDVILTYDQRWNYNGKCLLAWDEFDRRIRFMADPPWHPQDKPAKQNEVWMDSDEVRLVNFLQRNYGLNVIKDTVRDAVQVSAERRTVHAVRDFLQCAPWDGVPRLDRWLSTYLGVDDSPYSRAVGRWWLISGIARIMKPGEKADFVLILEGGQRIGKSSALEALALRREWFSDSKFEIGNKDSYQHLIGKWIIELGELDALLKTETSTAKAYFAANADTYRPSYGRQAVTMPRQCIFAGTVNLHYYLRDETGDSRYWPVYCHSVNVKKIQADAVQLWAEALVEYNKGAKWYPESAKDHAMCAEEQGKRGEANEDVWSSVIAGWLETPEAAKLYADQKYYTTPDILERALALPKSQMSKGHQVRLGLIMRALGYSRKQIVTGEARPRVFVKQC